MKMFKQYRNWIMKKLEKDRWYIEKDEIKEKDIECRDLTFLIVLAIGVIIVFVVILTA